ncbi:dienelactone hydrolase family protein [Alicyclobacillus dauci]|uniref:Dienelactone hydrolase family protein n=1 Tax=Alicyclobacillus dauci TaxID=1475485 RepID=A0ABY6YZF4_9BACL|nr:dienelactone hydrolase family protein [Alicyclobacillus dauci]WAH35890.1 dienelactone hydrolase family protein [Alicyclobacillus dauci]
MILTYHNHSDTVVVVLHEIYGVNQHIKNVCERLSEVGYDVVCPDLVGKDERYSYDQEDIAYKNFMNVGFMQVADNARFTLRQLRTIYSTVYVVGYRVGATTAWLCGAEPGLVDALVAYYGSRIRDYLGMQPQCPSLLLLPIQETSFNVDEVIAKLREKVNVSVHKYDGLHGFADPQNHNYSELASRQAFDDTIRFFSNISKSLLD